MNSMFVFGWIFFILITKDSVAVKIDIGKTVTEIAVTEELLATTATELTTKSTTSIITSTTPPTSTTTTPSTTTTTTTENLTTKTTVKPIKDVNFLSHKRTNNIRPKNITSSDYYCVCDLKVSSKAQNFFYSTIFYMPTDQHLRH